MAVIEKIINNRYWRDCGENDTLLHCWWNYKLVQPLWKTVWILLKNLRTKLLFDLAILPLGIYPNNSKTLIQKDICTRMFIATLLTVAKTWNQPKCPSMDEWIKKMCYIYAMEYYSDIKKE